MVSSQSMQSAKCDFFPRVFLFLIAGFFLFAVNPAGAATAEYGKETTFFNEPAPGGPKAAPVAPLSGVEREAAHTLHVGEHPHAIPVDIVNFAESHGEKAGDTLTIECVLSKKEDQAVLERIADKVFEHRQGGKYRSVVINWFIGANPQLATPWARTVMTKK